MKGNQFVTIASIVVAAASVAYAAGNRAQAATTSNTPVLITNNSSQCVPVTLYHSIAVQTSPKNAPTTPLFTKDVDEEVRNAFRFKDAIVIEPAVRSNSGTYTVPSGHTLLVRKIQGWTNSSTQGDQCTEVFVEVLSGNDLVGYWASPFTTVAGDPWNGMLNNTDADIVVHAGETLKIIAQRADSVDAAAAYMTIGGELVSSN